MADAVLKIGALVDKDSITSGMEEGADGVKKSTLNMSVYFNELQGRASAAWKKISDDTRAGAANVNAESLKIAESTKAVTAAQRELSAAMSLARNSAVDQTQSTQLLAAAQANLRARTLELKTAQEAIAEVSHKAVTDVQATSAAVRSFEGNPGIRAMEVFVGRTLGLGPALQSIFPLIGAAAFASILFGVGEKMYELEQKGKKAGEELARGFAEFNEKLSTSNDQLALTNAKLEEEIAKISGHPTNGVAVALAEATVQADRLQDALAADVKQLQALLRERSVSGFEGALAGVAGTATSEKNIGDASKELERQGAIAQSARLKSVDDARDAYEKERAAAGNSQQQLVAAAAKFHNAQIEADRAFYASQRTNAEAFARGMRVLATETAQNQARLDNNAKIQARDYGNKITPVDLTPERTSYEGAAEFGDRAAQRAHESQRELDDERSLGAAKQAKEGVALAKQAAEERLRLMETELSDTKALHNVTIKEEHDFWQARIAEFSKGSEQYKQIAEKIGQLDQQGAQKAKEAFAKYSADAKREDVSDTTQKVGADKAIEEVDRLLREQAEDVTRTGERWASYNSSVARGAEISARLQAAMEEGRLRILEQEHGISALGAAQEQARIHTEEHIAALKALENELLSLQVAGASLRAGDKGYEQNITQQKNVQGQIIQQQGNGQVQAQADNAAISVAVSKPYLTGFDAINNGWLKVQRDLIQGNRNIARDFAEMGLGLVQSMAQNFEKMLVQQAQMEARRLLAHKIANSQGVTDDASSAAESTGIKKASALEQIFIDAKQAAAGAYAAVVGIPFIGPILAPPAAVGAFAGVISLGAFEQGGVVGGSTGMAVPILAHAGERVLNPYQTQNFERMVNNSGGGGGTTVNFNGNHNFSQAGSDFKSQWAAHERHIVKRLKTLRREGKL